MKHPILVVTFGLALASLATTSSASGQETSRAQALFDEGKKLMQQGRFADACPKLAASQKLDPGAGTLMNLASCYDKGGQTASAWATFKEAAAASRTSGRPEWEAAAKNRATELEATLPRLTINVAKEAQVAGLVVERDGKALETAEWGSAIPVDPGKHTIRATAPSMKPWSSEAEAKASTATEVTVPPLVALTARPAEDPRASAPAASATSDRGSPRRGSSQRLLGLVVGGAGVVTLGIGSYFGLAANSTHDDALSTCNAKRQCNAAGQKLVDDANTQATVSTILFLSGGIVLASGAAIYLLAPKRQKVGLAIVPGLGSISAQGSF